MKVNLVKWGLLGLVVGIFFACDDPTVEETVVPKTSNSGVFILFQGSWGKNNAGITYYDLETKETTFDLTKGSLGDNAMDMLHYGSKLYVTVSESSVLTVMDIANKTVIRRISLNDESGNPRNPRYLACHEGKLFVSTYDGHVLRMDTTNHQVEATVAVGPNPEGIAVAQGKLYVANSGGYLPNYHNTVSVVDLATFKEERTITVGLNPVVLKADQYGDIYLTYNGNYFDIPSGFQRIDTKTHSVYPMDQIQASNFTIVGDSCYFYGVQYDENWATACNFGIFDVKTEALLSDPVITDGTKINTAYGIGVDPFTKWVYISDTDYQNPATIQVFNPQGKKQTSIEAGLNATQFLFY
ncbi:MAG: hypothetical protein LBR67_00870 [Dysgonamonadaceae bacterium]|nr:hypothetical protein [Dysgonamonadaceae bacterium]